MDQPKSLASFFSGLRPRNRPERGGTLRPIPTSPPGRRSSGTKKPHAASPPPPPPDKIRAAADPTTPPRRKTCPPQPHHDPSLLPDKHHARRALRKSGDFLGVTGINPRTGTMDVLTPTTSSSEGTTDQNPRLARLARRAQEAQAEYDGARQELLLERAARRKEDARAQARGVRWTQDEVGWASVAGGAPKAAVGECKAAESFLGRGSMAPRCRRPPLSSGGCLGVKSVERRVGSTVSGALAGGGAAVSLSSRTRAFQLRFPSLIPTRKRSAMLQVQSRDSSTGLSPGPSPMRMGGLEIRLRLENQVPADRWAETVNRDLDDVDSNSRAARGFTRGSLVRLAPPPGNEEAQRRSVYTSTITTTGCASSPVPYQPLPGCGAKAETSDDPMPESADSAAMVRLLPMTMTRRPSSSGSSERTDSWTCLGRAASPPAARPNSWPSTAGGRVSYPATTLQVVVDGRVVATIEPVSSSRKVASPGPPSDTISGLDETAISDNRTASPQQLQQDPPGPSLRGGNQRHKEMRKTMRRIHGGVDDSVGEGSRSSTPTAGRPHWWTTAARPEAGRKPAPGPRGGLDTALMAREAARTAYCYANRPPPSTAASPGASSGTVALVAAPLPPSVPVPATPDGEKNGEHPPPPPAAPGGDTGDPSSTDPPAVEPAQTSEWGEPGDSPILALQAVLAVVVQVGGAYWRLVKPVFVAQSAVRQRFEQGKST
ncbi:hypothetical protein QBC39DRAFT_374177 [Podospora conica]|nr:hypothetical protein QBC39DRAFT_374177 [Schizothecium conicum]